MSRSGGEGASAVAGGYRLDRLEVYNWGTFDGQVFSVCPRGQTALLVGQNGSGKSTLVDALLTLLVRPGVRNFNVAAGAKKTERDERSYLKGAYDRSGDDEGSGVQVRFLRPKGDTHSIILACFINTATGKAFSIAQLLYLASERVDKVYCFTESERSIRDDFDALGSTEKLLPTLQQRGWQATRKHVEFERWFAKTIHAKPKAMEVFNQTVAVKDIQRLNDFIRHHMLEPLQWDEKVNNLVGHFAQLTEAHQALVRIQRQLAELEPVERAGAAYREMNASLVHAEHLLAAADAFFAERTLETLTPEISRLKLLHENTRARKSAFQKELERVQDQCRRITTEIETVGGQRLREIPLMIDVELERANDKQKTHARYHDALSRAGVNGNITDADGLARTYKQMEDLSGELRAKIQQGEHTRDDMSVTLRDARAALTTSMKELASLNRRSGNLPESIVVVRDNLCEDLRLSPKDLPFAAELISVSPEAQDWEASIEKVLHGLALTLLVSERLYQRVSRYVDRTHLSADNQGQRLVYVEVGEQTSTSSIAPLGENSLVRKLSFRAGHPLLPWLQVELARRFDFTCCETIEELQACRSPALTRNRHIKYTGRRNEKDDRPHAIDPRFFVLGWDNREKKRRVGAEIDQLQRQEVDLQERLATLEKGLNSMRERASAIKDAAGFRDYDEMDFRRHLEEIEALQKERATIERQSDAIRALKIRLAENTATANNLNDEVEESIRSETRVERDILDAARLLENAERAIKKRRATTLHTTDEVAFRELTQSLGPTPLSVADVVSQQRQRSVLDGLAENANTLRGLLPASQGELLKTMNRFLYEFPEERKDLDAKLESLDSFIALHRRITDEDLPRHERRFKDRLNEKVMHEIGLFRAGLEQEKAAIQDKISTLNISLRRLEYRPGTHIKLEPRAVRDPEIVDFQARLRVCIEGSFEDSTEGNEARFGRIQELLVKLQDENNRRWREKVTDVRRWFDFVAAVIDRETGKAVSVYEDSSGQSGGEKAKLAFTILVAAIAYQYDLDPEDRVQDRFHFVVVDEMFSKVDDQHAEYALELFRQFGLQLLIVAPLDAKARVTQPYVGCYLHVNKKDNRSEIFEMTAREFEEYFVDTEQARTANSPLGIAANA